MTDMPPAADSGRQLTLGVLGHVDHGKTALVRALTGIETDRLAEERERGLSIVAGYAYFDTPTRAVDLIDAPGHQSFIRAMIGAASGIDAALLVVAANEGVMPQTREHVAVAQLLGVRSGVIALSKCDLVDDTLLEVCETELREYVSDTFLQDSPVVRVSALSGEGVDSLRDSIVNLPARAAVDSRAPFYMPIDRSFSISGFGRIVTGTVHAGTVTLDDELVIMPGEARVTVRGLQVHGTNVEQASIGARAALNLRVAQGERIEPGMIVGQEFAVRTSRRLDVLIEPVPGWEDALRNGASYRVLMGTAEAQARLRILDRGEESEHASILAQLRCDRDVSAAVGMRFILRRNSPSATVGGGVVIDPAAPRRRRMDVDANRALAVLAGASREALFEHFVTSAGASGLAYQEAAVRLCMPPESVNQLADSDSILSVTPQLFCSMAALEGVEAQILGLLEKYHREHPQHLGLRLAELVAAFAEAADESIVRAACERLMKRGEVAADAEAWRLASFNASANLSDAEKRLADRIESLFRESGIAAPSLSKIVSQSAAARDTLRYLIDTGRIVRLQTRDRASQLALHVDAIQHVQTQIQQRYPYPNEFAVSDIRDLLKTTRKHAVPLLEHLDATGFTLRRGDMRQIRK